jgi:microcystin-dependent protein
MLQMETFLRDDVFPSWFANALTKALSVATSQFQVVQQDPTHIQLNAGADSAAAVIAIGGLWRWVEANITLAHPGGAAGSYPVYVTARNNNITASPAPFTDATDYSFQLSILAPGVTPTINPGVLDVFRHVADVVWDGTKITRVDQLTPATAQHAGRHAVGGPDPLTPAMIGALPTADPTALAPGDLIFSGATTRTGAVLADGSAYSRADPLYAPLFAKVGTRWGAGDGSTTFNVLDARDKSPVGASVAHPLGTVYGAATQALAAANLPPHYHGYSGNTGFISSDHSHAWGNWSGGQSADHSHSYTSRLGPGGATFNFGSQFTVWGQGSVVGGTNGTSNDHAHFTSGQTGGVSANHTHAYSGNTDNGPGLSGTAFSTYHPVYAINVFVKL